MDSPARPVNIKLPCRARPASCAALVASLFAVGCSGNLPTNLPGPDMFDVPRTQRGIAISDDLLAQVTPGVTGRADVQALFGSPSATGTFEDREWFYISGVTRQRPGRGPAMENQQVVLVRFNDAGIVQQVSRIGAEARREVAFVQRETPSPGNERTFLQRLFGNLGRLGPGVPTSQGGPGASTTGGR